MQDDDEAMVWIRNFAGAMLSPDALDTIATRFDAAIAADVPEISSDRELQRDLHASNRDHARALLVWLIGGSVDVEPPPAAHSLARTIARRGLHLRVLMQIYRVGQKALLRYVAENASTETMDPSLIPDILIRLLERASHWLSVSLEILTDTYTEERERGLRGDFARRTETVQAILRGEIEDPYIASSRLGYPMSGHHLAVILWTGDRRPDETEIRIDALEVVARTMAAEVGARQLLTVPAGSHGLWAWLAGESESDLAAVGTTVDIASDVCVAVGCTGSSLDGFRRSHLEALATQRVSESRSEHTQLVRYLDIEITHLLRGHQDAAEALVARELRGLDGNDATSQQLRHTLRSYLRADRSPEAAARALGVHKNTVRYRVQRAEKLLGHPIGGAGRFKLELALDYAKNYGTGPDSAV